MEHLIIWNIPGVIAVVMLILFRRDRNAVWGGLTLGIIIGVILAVINVIRGQGFQWLLLKNPAAASLRSSLSAAGLWHIVPTKPQSFFGNCHKPAHTLTQRLRLAAAAIA
jgi:hypothetical protein